jgi:predicted nucleic acid-binding protein
VERDVQKGRLVPQPVKWRPIYRAAAQWAAPHSPAIGCRSLDVLHVTLAKKIRATELFTFDIRQKSLAVALGMTVKP